MSDGSESSASVGTPGFSAIPADVDVGADPFAEHPEVFAAGAFAGGLALALALRWLGRTRDG